MHAVLTLVSNAYLTYICSLVMILHVTPHNSLFHNHTQSGKKFVDKYSDSTKVHT